MSDQPTPYCPVTISVAYDENQKLVIEAAPCVGSRCASWVVLENGMGRCGLALGSQRHRDPQKPKVGP
jgi:hypothetical protein